MPICWELLTNSDNTVFVFPVSSVGKESSYNTGDLGSIPQLGRFPGEGKGYPFKYSGLENSIVSPWGHKELDTTLSYDLKILLMPREMYWLYFGNAIFYIFIIIIKNVQFHETNLITVIISIEWRKSLELFVAHLNHCWIGKVCMHFLLTSLEVLWFVFT